MAEGPSPKSLDSDKNFKHQHMLLCRDIGSLIHLRTFWESLAKEMFFFGSKTVFLGQEVHYHMVYIAYHSELNLQISNSAKNFAFVAK